MKHRLTYTLHIQSKPLIATLVLISLLSIIISICMSSIAYRDILACIKYRLDLLILVVGCLLFATLLFISNRIECGTALFIFALVTYVFSLYAEGLAYVYIVEILNRLISVLYLCTLLFAIIGISIKAIMISSTLLFMVAQIFSIIGTITLFRNLNWEYYSFYVLVECVCAVISKITLSTALLVFALKNILPPLTPLTPEKAFKHLNIAKKKGCISEKEYTAQRERILSEI